MKVLIVIQDGAPKSHYKNVNCNKWQIAFHGAQRIFKKKMRVIKLLIQNNV